MPRDHWGYWGSHIEISVYDAWPPEQLAIGIKPETPAYAIVWNCTRQIHVLAAWLNAGVIAHEQAHNAWAELTIIQKKDFEAEYAPLIKTDRLIRLLYSQHKYGLTSVIEGHAEVYRYLGQSMPEELKKFYPKLF